MNRTFTQRQKIFLHEINIFFLIYKIVLQTIYFQHLIPIFDVQFIFCFTLSCVVTISWSSFYCIKLFWHLLLYLSFLPIKFKADTNNFDQSLTSIKIVYRKHLKATHPKRIPPHINQNGQSSIGFQKNLFKPPTQHLPPVTFNTH